MCSRFGTESLENIDAEIDKSTPNNTIRSKKSVWTQFENFCKERKFDVSSEPLRPDKINDILKDWGFNMKKKDGTDYKELVVKQMWNSVAKQIQELYFKKFNIKMDPFQDIAFADSRRARDSHRRKLQLQPEFRKVSSAALSKTEVHEIITIHDENTPDGLQKKFFHLAAHELAWRGGEAANCSIKFFKEEYDSKGAFTGRIEYNSIISKTAQGGSKKLSDSKWLISNKVDESLCPVRILRKLLSKRSKNISTERLFLTPNHNWKKDYTNSLWYKNSPVGKNTISTWTRSAAAAIGINTKKMKISNHSHRVSTISHLAKAGIQEQTLIKMTGHSSSTSIKPYLQLDEEHHSKVVQEIRQTSITNTSVSNNNANPLIQGNHPNN